MEEIPVPNSFTDAQVHICIFPHLSQFLVIDLRPDLPVNPRYLVLTAEEVLNEEFYKELKRGFSKFLELRDKPFLNLMTLSQRVEYLAREKGLYAILAKVNEQTPNESIPSVSLFLCSGPAISRNPEDLVEGLREVLRGRADSDTMERCTRDFKQLVLEEREYVVEQEHRQLRQAIEGESEQYFTLWKKPE